MLFIVFGFLFLSLSQTQSGLLNPPISSIDPLHTDVHLDLNLTGHISDSLAPAEAHSVIPPLWSQSLFGCGANWECGLYMITWLLLTVYMCFAAGSYERLVDTDWNSVVGKSDGTMLTCLSEERFIIYQNLVCVLTHVQCVYRCFSVHLCCTVPLVTLGQRHTDLNIPYNTLAHWHFFLTLI